ncbi:serine/threonine-protein kinase [Nonomuraea sp. LP-02]|uniref:serine/threonine-protein kinase n=1 Tax=Nonomuraea sp. LP-02 TaxID=3097960 RepID=UPI002E33D797|nr:serine/threonine-protein kinase [Nonomuraea sp. LP-02]MED7926018.1 serine/threonine-protein kinase [Nonomuraea sp. LP-02]
MSVSRYEGLLLAGRYRLQAELGHGGMGRVWRGHDELLDRPVAVKEVTLDQRPPSEREAMLGRTMSEARLAARLSHPNVATVYDVVVADERPWIVLQLVPAPTLACVLAESGPLPPAAVAALGLQVLDALEAAHAAGIVHRDVKPANILLDSGGSHAVLTDFGLATSVERRVELTEAGLVVGTPAYIAPERARGGPPTPEADLWSLGVTLYTAVEGRSPFEQGNALATISAVLTTAPAPFELAGPLAPLLTGLLEKDPEQRWTAAAARRHLSRVAAAGPSAPPASPAPSHPGAATPAGPRTQSLVLPAPAPQTGTLAPGEDAALPLSGPRTGSVLPAPAVAGAGGAGSGAFEVLGRRLGRGQVRQVAGVAALIVAVLAVTGWPADGGAPGGGTGAEQRVEAALPATTTGRHEQPATPKQTGTPEQRDTPDQPSTPEQPGAKREADLRVRSVAVQRTGTDTRRNTGKSTRESTGRTTTGLTPGKSARGRHAAPFVPPGQAKKGLTGFPGKGHAKGHK